MFNIRQKLKTWGITRDVFLLGVARMIDSAGASLLIILIPLYVNELDLTLFHMPSTFVIGVLLSTFGLVNFLTQPAAGIMVDRLGKHRPFLLVGLGIYGIATLLFILLTSVQGLMFLRFCQGIGVALTVPATLSLITTYTKKEQRGTAMGYYNMMRMTGFSVGPLIGGEMILRWGFAPPILFAAVTAGIGLMLIGLLVREPDRPPVVQKKGYVETFAGFLAPDMLDFVKIAFGNMSMALSISIISSLQNTYNETLNQTSREFGLAFSVLVFAMVAVQMPISRLSDRVGRKLPIVSGLVLLAPVTIWMGYVTSTEQLIVARILQGITVAAVFAPSVALGGDKTSEGKRGQQLSLIGMSFVLGIGLGPVLGGFFAGYFFFAAPFWIGAVLSLIAAGLIAFTVPETITGPADEG